MALQRETLVFEMPGNGATVTKSLNIPVLPPYDLTYNVWGSGDISRGGAIDLTLGGTQVLDGATGSHTMPPVTEREDADFVGQGTVTLPENFIDVVVTTDHYVDGSPLGARIWVEVEYDAAPVLPDYYEDFAYARVLQVIGETDVDIAVDSVDRFPPNEILEASNFLLTIESDLNTGAFEIVRLLSVDSLTNTITVIRGIEGTEPQPHPSFVTIKGALTSGMLRRISGVTVADGVPEANTDVYRNGSMVFDINTEMAYIFRDGQWSSFTLGIVRQVSKLMAVTGQLTDSASDANQRLDALDDPRAVLPHVIHRVAEAVGDIADHQSTLTDLANIILSLVNHIDTNDAEFESRIADLETSMASVMDLDPVTAAIALGG